MTPLLSIRVAMMGGVLLFGFVSWFLHRTPDWTPTDSAAFEQLVITGRIIWVLVVGALALLWFRARGATSAAQASTYAIFAWALGETLALFGGVLYYVSDRSGWYVAGVVILAVSFVAFPGKPAT